MGYKVEGKPNDIMRDLPLEAIGERTGKHTINLGRKGSIKRKEGSIDRKTGQLGVERVNNRQKDQWSREWVNGNVEPQ